MYAILSDIHSNYEALSAVLEDLDRQHVDKVICLGDVVGYGPNPCECTDIAMEFDVTILGNHDQATLFDPEGFNRRATRAIFWTRRQLEESQSPSAEDRWEFIGELPRTHREGDYQFVHGSARNPVNEYVFPEDVYSSPPKMGRIFEMVDKYVFQGHTHVPGVFTEDLHFLSPPEIGFRYKLGESKAMINVGSVGQPRDGDPRSSYVLLDPDRNCIYFRRLEYDAATHAAKVRSIPELNG